MLEHFWSMIQKKVMETFMIKVFMTAAVLEMVVRATFSTHVVL